MSVPYGGRLEVRGWHVLASMIAFFGVVIAINVAFAIAAVRSFPGEDVQRSYLQGLHYNQTLAEHRAQAQIGWRAGAELTRVGDGAELLVSMRDRSGAPLDGLVLEGVLRWPANMRNDRALDFVALGDGLYRARLATLAPGYWALRAHAEAADGKALDFEADLSWSR